MKSNFTIQKYIIAGGNPTLLVWNCPQRSKKQIIRKYLGLVEQIGFISSGRDIPMLQMMGNELCINSTLALAYQLEQKGELYTSGVTSIVKFQNKNRLTTINIQLPYKQDRNTIIFEGIGFTVLLKKPKNIKKLLENKCFKYNLPAFGISLLSGNQIQPFVYVKNTNSLFEETACGSGSIATSIISGYSEIVQPTRQTIIVQKDADKFTISAKVVKIRSIK